VLETLPSVSGMSLHRQLHQLGPRTYSPLRLSVAISDRLAFALSFARKKSFALPNVFVFSSIFSEFSIEIKESLSF
jgi:hypothetical protein